MISKTPKGHFDSFALSQKKKSVAILRDKDEPNPGKMKKYCSSIPYFPKGNIQRLEFSSLIWKSAKTILNIRQNRLSQNGNSVDGRHS